MQFLRLLLAAPLVLTVACDDESGDGGSSTGPSSSGADTEQGETSEGPGETGEPPTTSGSDPTEGASTTADSTTTDSATTDSAETSTSADPTTGGSGDESSTGEVPTSGPGVLPGETGLDAFCRRYVECGGTYYADEQDCIDQSVNYWGECAEVTEALDAFGACMSEIACDDYDPDAYNPANTVCSEQWGDVGDAGPC